MKGKGDIVKCGVVRDEVRSEDLVNMIWDYLKKLII
jgi:hypothetical protein